MIKNKIYVGKYVYHKTDKAAFFKVREMIDDGFCIIEKIDNLGSKANREKLLYTVKAKNLKEDYI